MYFSAILAHRAGHKCVYESERPSRRTSGTNNGKGCGKAKTHALSSSNWQNAVYSDSSSNSPVNTADQAGMLLTTPATTIYPEMGSNSPFKSPPIVPPGVPSSFALPDHSTPLTSFTGFWLDDLFHFPTTDGGTMTGFEESPRGLSYAGQPPFETTTATDSADFPPIEVQKSLLNVYFDQIYPGAPFIHKGHFYDSFEGLTETPPNPALLFAIFTMASCVRSHLDSSISTPNLPAFFHSRALFYARDNVTRLRDLFQTVQALILSTVYEHGLARHGSPIHAYLLSSEASRLAVVLGLHHLDESYDSYLLHQGSVPQLERFHALLDPPATFANLEERRRTFWMAHLICQTSSLITLCPPTSLDLEENSTCLPAESWEPNVCVWFDSWMMANA